MKISASVNVMVVVLIVSALMGGFLVRRSVMELTNDGRIVNFAGKIRGGTQRLIKLELVKNHVESDKLISSTEKIIAGIINGDSSLGIPKVDNELFITGMKKVDSEWKKLRQTITESRANPALVDQLVKESEVIFKLADDTTAVAETLSSRHVNQVRDVMVLTLIFNMLVFATVWFLSRRKVLHPIKQLSEQVKKITDKDLRIIIQHKSNDEIGHLADAMNSLIDFFNEIINNTIASINNVVNTMDIVRTKTDKTSEGVKDQLSQTMQIATASTEMSQTITDIATNAAMAAGTSSNSMTIAEKGKDIAFGAINTVSVVHATTSELATLIGTLSTRVNEIGDILGVINDIADQTNLLALNAAIEAARAGEQGRGFAVVADEVRKLAERTKVATTEISSKINAVQSESDRTTKSMENAAIEVSKTTELMNQVGEVLNDIVNSTGEVRDQITTIATAIDEQACTTDDVVQNVEKTSNIAQEMERESVEVMKEVNQMIASAEELRKTTTGFKTRGAELLVLDLAMTDHRLWVNRILFCIKGGEHIDANTLLDHTMCRLGKWYYSDGKDLCGQMHCYGSMEHPHKKLHALGKEIVTVYNSGNSQRAHEMFVELENLSKVIIAALKETKQSLSGHLVAGGHSMVKAIAN
ncbi:MAG: CZB domain-containing protein [Nitrospirae bacterium]|nr:CZB domain-containing protein [Nitrospirota bacterium]